MVSLLELLLSELAGHHRSAGGIHSIGEVLAGQANPSPLPVLKLTGVDVLPLVHNPLADGTDVLIHPVARGQALSEKLLISSGQHPLFVWWWMCTSCSISVSTSCRCSHRRSSHRRSSHWSESIPLMSGNAKVDRGSALPGSLCRCISQRSEGRCHDSRGFKNPTG